MSNPDSVGYAVDVALIHYPVLNRKGETIGSAVTNLDLHDIARAARTYGVDNYWVVTPYEDQQQLVREILHHWDQGHGATYNPKRKSALSLVRLCSDMEEVTARSREKWGEMPLILATCAAAEKETLSYQAAKRHISQGRPLLLLFGTGWGLAPEVLGGVDGVLPAICGQGKYNHLSVRSAASIVLDRLLAKKTE